jgi:hypothetical protein
MYFQSFQSFKIYSFFQNDIRSMVFIMSFFFLISSFQPLYAKKGSDQNEKKVSDQTEKKDKRIKSGQFTEQFAAGITIGVPTGLNFLMNLEDKGKLNNTLAYHFMGGWTLLSSDWRAIYFKRFEGLFDPYIGVGAEIFVSQKEFLVAARIPVGIEYVFPIHPFVAFLEFVPAIGLIPQTVFIPQLAAGIQFRF